MTAIVVVLTALLVACGDRGVPVNTEKSVADEAAAKMVYTKDPRSGLCFGVVTVYANRTTNVVIVNVPCKDVESLIGVEPTSK